MRHTYNFISASVDKAISKFLSNDPRFKYFAPLSLDATNFENGYHK